MKTRGTHDKATIEQFKAVLNNAVDGALMADGHLGYVMPVGGVVAYEDCISPAAVGYDIACGNKAARLDVLCDEIEEDLPDILDELEKKLSFGMGRVNKTPVEHDLFWDDAWLVYPQEVREDMWNIARKQLGTIGSGNHYVDIFRDENGYVWVGVHFGSRGLGHKTCTGFLNEAVSGSWGDKVPEQEVLIPLYSELGYRYSTAMDLAGRYAYAGRDWVVQQVADTLGVEILEEVHNHHNYAWDEVHNGKSLIVIRKGATPAFPGQKGFIGGSMGDDAVIVEGIESDASKDLLYSTVHGAGRVMSRTQAAGKYRMKRPETGGPKERVKVKDGLVTPEMMASWLSEKGVLLRGGGLDESPHAYRRLSEVLESHKDTIKILHTLTPLAVMMAGDDVFDPYKD